MAFTFSNTGRAYKESITSGLEELGPKTLSVWVFVDTFPTSEITLWEKAYHAGHEVWERLSIDGDGKLVFQVARTTGGAPISISQTKAQWFNGIRKWTHVVFAVDYTVPNEWAILMYLDGLYKAGLTTTTATQSPSDSDLFVGNSYTQNKACEGVWLRDLCVYGSVLTPWQVYRLWAGEAPITFFATALPKGYWQLKDDVQDTLTTNHLALAGDYEQHDFQPENIRSPETTPNPFTMAYTWLWYLLEIGGVNTLIDRENHIRYDLGHQDPQKDEVQDSDLPELRIVPITRSTTLVAAADLSTIERSYSVELTTGENRVDEGLFGIDWTILQALYAWKPFDRRSNGLDYIKNIEIGPVATEDMNAALNRGIEGWSSICQITITMSFQEMTFPEET